MNLTHFRPEMRGNVEKNNNPFNIRSASPKHQTSENYLRTSHLMSC